MQGMSKVSDLTLPVLWSHWTKPDSPFQLVQQNIIMWMDHRAEEEIKVVNATKNKVLDFVGGKISLEMQIPKLLWLKNKFGAEFFKKVDHFFDLPDFLTWKATGVTSRSLCSLVCKWTYQVEEHHKNGFWDREFFDQVGLGDLKSEQIGLDVRMPGSVIGTLTSEAAAQLGLTSEVKVGTSLIDAHAGALGMIGCNAAGTTTNFVERLGLICGTSSCHMAVSEKCLFVPGVWGPYFSAVLPDLWLSEGGQSATGRLLDHVIQSHPARDNFKDKNLNEIPAELNKILESIPATDLTSNLHIVPDFHGNRSPLADSTRKGMMSGLDFDTSTTSLATLYLATIQAIAYGTKHIYETLQKHGHKLNVALMCGGLAKNPVFVQTTSDVLEMPVLLPEEPESVLLGAAILGATAAGAFPTVHQAAISMGGAATKILPQPTTQEFHRKKYKVFLKMLDDQAKYKEMMSE
ncbi:FGGY carbohydrate kinase domain-containing protein isoform X2 [Neocloeon triangulifer]|uniref:FGGY carbohydrate kinase domain-containing protein isoform X2 n=1 Tax=Neocloeon triangulifer TaxID=2078957 RepID=UPI00286F67A7|nr:FGGY carbohydrate kinase domain-containing protein isoform X2 [Neocloeon triangulifer]